MTHASRIPNDVLPMSLTTFKQVAPGVGRLALLFVNVYVVDLPEGGGWTLIDTGPPGTLAALKAAIDGRYGPGARPNAIVLTHAHFDHAGNVKALAQEWNVPVYVGAKELPYVTGRSDYAPGDPTPGGAIAQMARLFPSTGTDVGDAATVLPDDGTVPPMPGWRSLATPGHSAGHTSFIRESDGVAIVGDVIATFDMDSWAAHANWPRELARPAVPFTPDWPSARRSIRALADANPSLVAAGHGLPIAADDLGDQLRQLAEAKLEPTHGRYASEPATYDERGALASVPPPVADPVKKELLVGAGIAGVVVGLAATSLLGRSSRRG